MKNKKAEKLIEDFFSELGIKLPIDTPKRYIKMIKELTEYQNISNQDIAKELAKTFPVDTETKSKNMVVMKNIQTFSVCEHHIALMYDMNIAVGYIPNNTVVGLSKIARACEMVCKRLQLQERIGTDILEVMNLMTNSNDIAVCISGKHSCMTARGVRNVNAVTTSTHFCGMFSENEHLQDVFLKSVK